MMGTAGLTVMVARGGPGQDQGGARPQRPHGPVRSGYRATMAQTAGDVAGRFGLGPIDQISFAVADADEAALRYRGAVRGRVSGDRRRHARDLLRGRPASVRLRLGFGRTGPIEVELVQVVSGEYPTKDYLAKQGEGVRREVPGL